MPIDFAWSIHHVCINIIARTCTIFLYASQKGEHIMLWPPSVCPSVDFSCPLHNYDTIHDIFKKLGPNVNHHQMMCSGKKKTKLHLHFYGIMPL